MNRNMRTVIVVSVALLVAAAATFLVYRTIITRPVREVEIAHSYAAVAAHPLTLGALLTADDVKLVPWPAANPVPGGFVKAEDVVGRGVIAPVAENEPFTGFNVASKEAGSGLPPTIPTGMRAISVRVNEVIGVAGFVVPGTRVDVMVILRSGGDSLARVVVSNVTVLAAGTRYDQELAKEGKPLPSSVVTLLVSPEDAERVGLASTEGQILLTLRNPMDAAATESVGMRAASLAGGAPAPLPTDPSAKPRPHVAAAPPPPPPPAPPPPYTVEVIRAAQRSQEVLK